MRPPTPGPAAAPALPSERDRAVLRSLAARLDPNDAGAHNNLGVLYVHKGMLEEAVAAFTRALAIDARMSTAERNLQIAWRDTGLFDREVAALEQRLAGDPADRESRRRLADALLLAGEAARAIPQYEALVRDVPDDAHALGALARACQRLGQLEAADRWVKLALAASPADDGLRFLLAELSYHRGLSDEALAILRDLATRRPDDADLQYLLGFVLGDLGHHAEGAEATRRALKLNPSLGRAEANLSLERRAEAQSPVAEPEPVSGGALAHFNLGLAFRQKGYYAQALKEYALALRHGEDRDLVTQATAEVHLLGQDGPAATRLYDQLVAAHPDSPKLWNERGVALHQSGRAADALESYERSVSLDPTYALALNNLGVARFHAGRDDLAVDAFRRALTVQPSFVKARLNLALLLLKRKEFPLCLEAYRQVLRLEAEHPVAWNGVGLVLAEMRQFEDARNAFGRAIDARPDYAEAHYNLSFTLSNLGDFNGALRETKRALELDPYYVAQKFELAIDFEYENPRVAVSPDLDGDRRETAVREFTLDVSQLESLFDVLAPAALPALAPASNASPYAAASASLASGDLERAAAEIQRALDAGADRAEGLALLGDVFLRKGAHGEALDRYRQARLIDATSRAALAGEVRAFVLLGRGAQALELAEALAVVAPRDVDALLLVARARADAGTPSRALEALDQARRLAPARADVLKHVGDVARVMGDVSRAVEAYRQAVSLDAGFVAARLELASLYLAHGATEDAEAELVAALGELPTSVEAALQLAALRRALRRAPDTIELLVTVLQRDPWNLDALASLGESLFLSGRPDDARLAFARVLRFDPDHVAALYFEGVLLADARQFDAALDRWSSVIALEPAGDFARRARRDTRTALDLQRIFAARDVRQITLGAA
ncbi:MAG TPA: tetratricopeptide repeat protein [Gemmatimonadaceae bacterium]